MRTVDRLEINAPVERVWPWASLVERWPEILPHYRWVRRLSGDPGGTGVVEMAAWRPFGPLRWPTWWKSDMRVDAGRHEVRYRHIEGITRGMDVVWTVEPLAGDRTLATIVHSWTGPAWPLVGPAAANSVIGPVFVSGIARRTLAGIAHAAQQW